MSKPTVDLSSLVLDPDLTPEQLLLLEQAFTSALDIIRKRLDQAVQRDVPQ